MFVIAANDRTLNVDSRTAAKVMTELLTASGESSCGVYEGVRRRYVSASDKEKQMIDELLILLTGSTFERITDRILKMQEGRYS